VPDSIDQVSLAIGELRAAQTAMLHMQQQQAKTIESLDNNFNEFLRRDAAFRASLSTGQKILLGVAGLIGGAVSLLGHFLFPGLYR
jgi:hypothetical protein